MEEKTIEKVVEKRDLYFIDSHNRYRLIHSNVREEEAYLQIHKFLNEHNYLSYYIRTWDIPEGRMYDVGSHTEFFLWGWLND